VGGGIAAVLHRQDDAGVHVKQFLAAAELHGWSGTHWIGAMGDRDGVIAELAARVDGFPSDDPLNP